MRMTLLIRRIYVRVRTNQKHCYDNILAILNVYTKTI